MRRILMGVMAVVVASAGCSLNIESIDPKWDGTTEPECGETAWCVGTDRCAPTEASCETLRAQAGSDAPACVEAK